MNGIRRAADVARKDLLLEWRSREAIAAMLTFALLIALLLGFTLGSDAPAASLILWIALALGAVLGVTRPTQAEVEGGTLEALLLYPGSREHLYWGKCAALFILLMVLQALLLPISAIVLNVDVWRHLHILFGTGALALIGISSVGTLLAALVLQVRGRELLMPLLLLPIALPVLLAAVRATEAILGGTSPGLWLGVLAVFDAVFLLVCPILFEVVVEA